MVSYTGVSVLSLLRIGLLAVIDTLRSANLAVADFRFQKVVLHSLFQITASGGFAAAENTASESAVCTTVGSANSWSTR